MKGVYQRDLMKLYHQEHSLIFLELFMASAIEFPTLKVWECFVIDLIFLLGDFAKFVNLWSFEPWCSIRYTICVVLGLLLL